MYKVRALILYAITQQNQTLIPTPVIGLGGERTRLVPGRIVVYMLCVYMTTPIRPADHLGSMTSTA